MSKTEDKNEQAIILDPADQPVIAHAVLPELSKPRAMQSLPDATRIGQLGYPFIEEPQDALAVLRVEFVEFPIDSFG
jgi:hypothetical protein